MRLHLLSGGRLRMRKRLYYPEAERDETFELPVSCGLIRHAQGNVLFDTGCSPRAVTETATYWRDMSRAVTPIFAEQDVVVQQLPKAGLAADDIDVVICSHLHSDHCGCNAAFPRATVICHAAELAAARGPAAIESGYIREDWDHGRHITTFEGQRDIFCDGRLTLIEAIGHTPGSSVLHVALDRSVFLLASDVVPVAAVLERRYAPRLTWDVDRSLAALDEITRLQADGATVVFGHDDAQWRSLRTGAALYE